MIPYKNNSIVRVSEGPTGVFLFVLLNNDVSNLPVYADGVRTGSTAIVQDTGKVLLYHEDNGWGEYSSGGGYPEPTGTVTITYNGEGIDVKDYAEADVAVPNSYAAGDEGKVVSNGALVAQSSLTVTENDTYDTTLKNEVVVNVSGGGGTDRSAAILDRSITSYSNSDLTALGSYAFASCVYLTSVNLPNVVNIDNSAFESTGMLTQIELPAATEFGSYVFISSGLHTADLGNAQNFRDGVFNGCYDLDTLIIRTTSQIAYCTGNILNNTAIGNGNGYIYVPDALKATYQADSIWSQYANRFRSLEDYTVDGTTTGALDPNKI